MALATVIQLSDTHLSPTHGFFNANRRLLLRRPEIVSATAAVVTGDLTVDGADRQEEALAVDPDRPAGVFLHKPLFLAHPDETDRPGHATLGRTGRLFARATGAGACAVDLDRLKGNAHRHLRDIPADSVRDLMAQHELQMPSRFGLNEPGVFDGCADHIGRR